MKPKLQKTLPSEELLAEAETSRKVTEPEVEAWGVKTSALHGDELFEAYKTEWLKESFPDIRWEDVDKMLREDSKISRNSYVASKLAECIANPACRCSIQAARQISPTIS
jgi:hypothetical protein